MPRGAARVILDVIERMGVTILPNWRMERHAMASCLRSLFELLAVDCVLDVGANVGQYRTFLRDEVGFGGWIVSFEPIPGNVAQLRMRAAADPRWRIEPFALGALSGPATFNVTAQSTFSSFLQPNDASVALFSREVDVTERIDVEVRTLDDVLPSIERELGVSRVYLKMDTQGFDLAVVEGGTLTMPRLAGLQTEASVKPIYCDMPDYATVIARLESLGFELTGLFPVNSGTFPRMLEFDCVMVATTALATARRST